ncbi:MAG: polyprenol phosphomannose-dependent alpha 1,6 mannosyltransferase MptB [Thermomicrobiales bacterium]
MSAASRQVISTWAGNRACAPARDRARRRLLAASLGSGLVYSGYAVVAFLPRHVAVPTFYLFDALGHRLLAALGYVLALALLFAAAMLVWWTTRQADAGDRWLRRWAIAPPVVFALLLTCTQPLTSRDLFHYLMEGRVLGRYGANPYLFPPSTFPHDVFFRYTNWADYTSPYGPIWNLLGAALTRIAGDNLIWSVLLFKLVALAGYLACGVLIWAVLRALGRPPLPGTAFWLWNPLVLLEFPGAGHNDVLMLAVLLGGLWLYLTGRYQTAFVALAVAGLVKAVAFAVLPLALWHYLAPLPGWAARCRTAARLCWRPALLICALMGPFWIGLGTLGPVREADHYYASPAHVVRLLLQRITSTLIAGRIVHTTVIVVLAAAYLLLLRRIAGPPARLVAVALRVMLALLVLWTFFVPWYCAWAVALAAALGDGLLSVPVVVLCAGALASYLFQLYLPLRMAISVEFRSTLSALLVFVPFGLSLALVTTTSARRRQRQAGRLPMERGAPTSEPIAG